LVLAGFAMAAKEATLGPEWDNTTLGKLTYAYKAGELTYENYLTYRVIAMHAATKYVPAQYLGEVFSPTQIDGTPLMTELRFNWNKLSAQQKELIRQATGFIGWSNNSPNSVSYRFDWDGNYQYYDTPEGNVRVHYETTGTHATTAAVAQNYANWYEESFARHMGNGAPPASMGAEMERDDTPLAGQYINDGGLVPLRDAYNEPGQTPDSYYSEGADFGFGPGGNPQGDNRMDVYIRILDAQTGAYTQYEYYDPNTDRLAAGFFFTVPVPPHFGYDLSTQLHEGDHAMLQGFCDVSGESWYKECTSVWAQDELWNHPDSYTMNECNEYLSLPWYPLDYWVQDMGTLNGYRTVIWNFFITDYGKQTATPGSVAAGGLYNFWMVRRVWEAMANGDYWYSKTESLHRNAYQAQDFAFDYYDEPMNDYTDQYAMLQKWFGEFCKWNWYTGNRADQDHYRWGSLWNTAATSGEFSDYPVDVYPFEEGTYVTHKPDHMSSNYFIFNNIPSSFSGLTIKFENDEGNPPSGINWTGWVFTPSAGGWTATQMFTPHDGIVRLNFGGTVPSQVGMCIADCAQSGADLSYRIMADNNTDNIQPNVTLGIARPSHNPRQFEVIVGSDKDLFGEAVASGDFTFSSSHVNTDPNVYPDANTFTTKIPTTLSTSNRTSQGVYSLPGTDGSGHVYAQVADTSGNIVYKDKAYSAAGMNSIGGDLTLGGCKVYVPQGALSESTWFTIVADPELADKANRQVTKLQGVASLNSGAQFYGDAYDIQPTWAKLSKKITVALSYADFGVDESRIAIQKMEGNTVRNIGGVVDRLHQRVVAEVPGPGIYILGIGQNDGFGNGGVMPSAFFLGQNYPNPVTSSTTIRYSIGSAKNATIKIYSLNGALVRTLVDGPSALGQQAITWDGKDAAGRKVAAGVYVYTLNADGQTATRKMVIAH
jgi:hypothetical protein